MPSAKRSSKPSQQTPIVPVTQTIVLKSGHLPILRLWDSLQLADSLFQVLIDITMDENSAYWAGEIEFDGDPDDPQLDKLVQEQMERAAERQGEIVDLVLSCVALKCMDPSSKHVGLEDMGGFFCSIQPGGDLDAQVAELSEASKGFLQMFDKDVDTWFGKDRDKALFFDFANPDKPAADEKNPHRTAVIRTLGSMRRNPLFDLSSPERKTAHELVCSIAITLLQLILHRMESAGFPFKIKYISDTLRGESMGVAGCSDNSIRCIRFSNDALGSWMTNKFFAHYAEKRISPRQVLHAVCDMNPLNATQALATLDEIGQTIDLEISEEWAVPKVALSLLTAEILQSFRPEVLAD